MGTPASTNHFSASKVVCNVRRIGLEMIHSTREASAQRFRRLAWRSSHCCKPVPVRGGSASSPLRVGAKTGRCQADISQTQQGIGDLSVALCRASACRMRIRVGGILQKKLTVKPFRTQGKSSRA